MQARARSLSTAIKAFHSSPSCSLPTPHHPPRQLVLPGQINPRILSRQQQLHPHVENAGHLQGGEGTAAFVVAQVVLLAGVSKQPTLCGRCVAVLASGSR